MGDAVQLSLTPESKSQQTLADIINANIKLQTKVNLSVLKDILLTVGVMTPEIQAVLEGNARLTVNLPVNVEVTVNIKENNFRVEIPPCKEDINIVSLRFNTSAITRNVEEAPAYTSTPLVLPQSMSDIMEQSFDSSPVEQDERVPIQDIIPSKIKSVEKHSQHHLESVRWKMCFEGCTFGCKVCVRWSNAYSGCLLGDSFSNILGENTLNVTLGQDNQRAPIEKLRFTIHGGVEADENKVHLLRNEDTFFAVRRLKGRAYSTVEDSESSEQSSDEHNGRSNSSSSSSSSSSSNSEEKHVNKGQSHQTQSGFDQDKQERKFGIKEQKERHHWYNLICSSEKIQDLIWPEFVTWDNQSKQESSSSSSSSSESSQHSNIRRKRDLQEMQSSAQELLPYFTIVAQAVRTDNIEQGYKLSMYMNIDMYKIHLKMVATELATTNWRAYLDSMVLPFRIQKVLCWGHNCKDYKIELKTALGQIARHPAVQTKITWSKLPSFLEKPAFWAMEFLPGIAYISGFSVIHHKNSPHEVLLRIISTSPTTNAVILKVPGETFYKDGFCAPFELPAIPTLFYQNQLTTTFSILDLASWVAHGDQAICEVGEDKIVTFDKKVFNAELINQDSELLVAQDCNKKENYPNFRIRIRLPRRPKPPRGKLNKKEIHLNITQAYIKILPTSDRFTVLFNDEPVLNSTSLYVDPKDGIMLYQNETTVAIEAPQFGLQNVTYDGFLLRITTTSALKGKTCGLCGDNNGEVRNERRMPNQELALNDREFFNSWTSAVKYTTEMATDLFESETTLAS